jgi:hypothetical protein
MPPRKSVRKPAKPRNGRRKQVGKAVAKKAASRVPRDPQRERVVATMHRKISQAVNKAIVSLMVVDMIRAAPVTGRLNRKEDALLRKEVEAAMRAAARR